MANTKPKNVTLSPFVATELRKAMLDVDVTTEQLGNGDTGRAWRYRLTCPGRMTMEDFLYLCDRLYTDPVELFSNAMEARDRAAIRERAQRRRL